MDRAMIAALISEVANRHKLNRSDAEDFQANAWDMNAKPDRAAGIVGYFEGKPRYAALAGALEDFRVQLTNLQKYHRPGAAAQAMA